VKASGQTSDRARCGHGAPSMGRVCIDFDRTRDSEETGAAVVGSRGGEGARTTELNVAFCGGAFSARPIAMNPTEKADIALNTRLDRLQANLRETSSDTARRFLFQSLVVCVGLGEALTDYVKTIGEYAQARYGQLKQTHTALSAEHAALLTSGNELLERLKANPGDPTVRHAIERAQRDMAAIQKNLRRGADSLQRDLAPSMAMVDELALTVRRFGEAGEREELKRVLESVVEHVRELYRTQPSLPSKNLIDTASWGKSAVSEMEQTTDFYEAYASAGYQVVRAMEVMTIAVSPTPPATADEISARANAAVATRLKAIAERLAADVAQ